MLARTVEIGIDPPVFDMIIRPQEVARQGIAGFLDTLFHVAKEYPGEITVSDNRQVITQIHRPDKPEPKEKTSESFADIMQRIAVDHVRGSNGLTTSNGLPIRKAA
jgi:ABC-type lipopolysaccharide export system ATPase subunit